MLHEFCLYLYLWRKCRWASENVHLDGETPETFDTQYYHNLKKNTGLLSTDQLLYSDSRTKPIANGLSYDSSLFKNQFGVSMVKLSSILDYTSQDDGEIRVNCKYVNKYWCECHSGYPSWLIVFPFANFICSFWL